MIYPILKTIVKLAISVFFKNIHIEGQENIPDNGPLLIVANHPNSFLDPLSIAVLVNQKISFLAKGAIFKNRVIGFILRKMNIVAIHRAADNPKLLKANKNVFRDCFTKLSKKGTIMIFPEGTSEMERRLRKIKTGAARIALGAEKEYDYNLDVVILPVGLNYTNNSLFRSELIINIGKPINVLDYKEEHINDEVKAVQHLTKNIETSIKELIVTIDKKEYDELIGRVESIYSNQVLKTLDGNAITQLKVSQEIVNAVKYVQDRSPEVFSTMKFRINNYFERLAQIKISDKSMRQNKHNANLFYYSLKSVIKLIIGFPFWLFGFVHSYIPYKLTRTIALSISKDQSFYGALLMSLGTLLFVVFYSLAALLSWFYFHSPMLTIIYILILTPIGLFTIYYSRFARKLYYNWKFMASFFSKRQLISELVSERKKIIIDLEKIRTDNNL